MSYTINVSVEKIPGLELVECSVWHYANGGTWDLSGMASHKYVLTMGGSGTSGMLRFRMASGKLFAIAVGIHNWAPWSGVAIDLQPKETLQAVHKEFYAGGPRSSPTVKDSVGNSSNYSVGVLYTDEEKAEEREYSAFIGIAEN